MRVKWTSIKEMLFSNSSIRQTVAKNTFWLTAGNLTGRLIKAALIIYVARVLGAAGYGVFSYAVSLAGFFSLFSDIGITGILIREGARNPKALPEYLATSFGIKAGLLLITNIAILTIAPFFAGNVPEVLPLIPVAALLITFDSIRELAFAVVRSKEKMQTEAGISIITNVAITILGIGAIFFFDATPMSLMIGYTLGSVVGTIAAYWIVREDLQNPFKYFRKKLVMPMIMEGLPFGLMGLLGSLMLNIDTLMVGWLTSAADAAKTLGIYAAAQRPVQVLYIVPSILSVVFFPALARLATLDKARFRNLLENALSLSFLIAIPLVVGGLILGSDLMLMLFGPEYISGTATFKVLLFTLMVVYSGGFIANAVLAFDSQKSFWLYLALGLISNIVLDFILIPLFGIFGSALATVAAQILANAVIWRKLKSIQEFEVLRHLPKMIFAGIGMGVVVLALSLTSLPVLAMVAIGAAAYVLLLYILKEPLLKYVPH
jgi:O-antigen/teichoic acid export membrane protein